MYRILIFLLLFSFYSFSQTVVIKVPGMVCQMCVQGMKKNFKSAVEDMDKDVTVSLDDKTVKVKLKKKISDEEIKQRVRDAGYNAQSISWEKSKKK